ncbi:MAG: hypothetical protein IJ512_08950, partial [Ruminococcus sp.]|nr:hypothetical protein [Ruminococcus sp.]
VSLPLAAAFKSASFFFFANMYYLYPIASPPLQKTKKAGSVSLNKTRPQTSTYMTKGESEKSSSNSPFHPLFLPSKS